MTNRCPRENEPWFDLAWTIWRRGLVPLRAHKVEIHPDPDKPGTFKEVLEVHALTTAEDADFGNACKTIHLAARKAGADESALAMEIASVLEKGAIRAVQVNARRAGRLMPEQRREYRAQSSAARKLAQFLAREIREREIPHAMNGLIDHTFTEGDDRSPQAIADLLIQRKWSPVTATDRGAKTASPVGAEALARAVGAINDLHWLADLLRGDADRARSQGAPVAAWKTTARLLRALFEDKLCTPLAEAVAVLAGLAHQCDVPPAEVSRLSKP